MIEKAYNLTEVVNILGIKKRTLRSWIDKGKIKAFRYPDSKMWFVKASELKRFAEDEIIINHN